MDRSVPVDLALHCPAGNVLGEGPLWDPEARALVWVDIPRGRVMRGSVWGLAVGQNRPSESQ